MTCLSNERRFPLRLTASLALSAFLTSFLVVSPQFVAIAKDCARKGDCLCECDYVKAEAKGDGPCSIAENGSSWCSISYGGNTGSVGPDSLGPAFSTKTAFFDDHRSPEYAAAILALRKEGIRKALETNVANMPLLIRASYVSVRKIDSKTLQRLDETLAMLFKAHGPTIQKAFFDKNAKPQTLTAAGNGRRIEARVGPGHFQFRESDVLVEFIWRDLVPG